MASSQRRWRGRARRFPCVVTALSIALLYGRGDASVVRMERSAALFPIASVLEAMERPEPDMLPADLNRLAGALALAGRAAEAERALAASLR